MPLAVTQDIVERNATATRHSVVAGRPDLRGDVRGLAFVAFVRDAFARRIVGWRFTQTLGPDQMLDALEQALYDRPMGSAPELVHHNACGLKCPSIRYTERLAKAGIEPSVGGHGDSYDNALAESVILGARVKTGCLWKQKHRPLRRPETQVRCHFTAACVRKDARSSERRLPGPRVSWCA